MTSLRMAGEDHLRSPFRTPAPSIVLAAAYGGAALLWLVADGRVPGGRWLAVHLLTLGVISNLVLTFSQHFARTSTRAPGDGTRADTAVYNAGAIAVLVGLPTGTPWLVAVGASVATTAVVLAHRRLRRLRRAAVGARFAWIVRIYERAHGAFVHGAVLGALLGTGLLPGPWHLSARLAHLHVNVLGWAGLTLLATLVFFGPTLTRTRIEEGADAVAARSLRWSATALSLAVLALLASGVGGSLGTALRLAAGTGLAVFAAGATAVVVPVAAAAARARPTGLQVHVLAVCTWVVTTLWADAAVVAAGAWWLLDAVGLALLLGVLLQAVLATLAYLAPMLRGRSFAAREAVLDRIGRRASGRALLYNSGVFATVCGVVLSVAGGDGTPLARLGWILVVAVVLHLAAATLRPVRPSVGPSAAAWGEGPGR